MTIISFLSSFLFFFFPPQYLYMIYLIWLQKASGRKQTWRSADCVRVRGGFNSLVSLHPRAAALASSHEPHALILHVCKITLKLSNPVLGARSLLITWCWYFLLGSKTIGFRAPGWVPYLCLEAFFIAKACLGKVPSVFGQHCESWLLHDWP